MGSNKSEEEKEFLIACRRKIHPGITAVPFWIMQKAGKRIYNTRQKRHWRSTNLGELFRQHMKEQGKEL